MKAAYVGGQGDDRCISSVIYQQSYFTISNNS